MFEGIKQATRVLVKKTEPLKTKTGVVISDCKKQMEWWVEHYLDLYSSENSVFHEALDTIQNLPILHELDAEPTLDELSKAIDTLACRKVPGNDSIPLEVIKLGKSVLVGPLHKFLCLCWKEGKVPQDIQGAEIITLYKNKGDQSNCNNYCGIPLLSIVEMVFACIVLCRLHALADCIYPESQCGCRAKRSTMDMIFAICQLQIKMPWVY